MNLFYGNTTDISHIHFQFDRIFSNRHEMDQACKDGEDGIYTGRFVLVKYDYTDGQDIEFKTNILYGYKNDDDENLILYLNSSFEQPYIYTNTPSGKAEEVIEDTIIYERNALSRLIDGKFYKCIGAQSDQDNRAKWELISDFTIYGKYLANFREDFSFYQSAFDPRGYDGTIWEKIYSEGYGKFVQVARLNGSIPAFELKDGAPSELPMSAYIDKNSSSDLYQINVPSQWGFRIKKAEEDAPSDYNTTQKKYQYNEDNQPEVIEEDVKADVYLNLTKKEDNMKLSHDSYAFKDTENSNEIIIAPTGKSGKKYYDTNGNFEEQSDTYELSIHLPIIGNMIDEGYDLIYGTNKPITTEEGKIITTRPKDINWYEGDAGEVKTTGDSALGGKNYDLNTLAGTLNTMHARLGQNIISLPHYPDSASLKFLSSDYIYYVEDEKKYYRLGLGYIYTALDDAEDYNYSKADNVSVENYLSDTYYDEDYNISTSYDENKEYYKKNIKEKMYDDVTDSLMEYKSRTYFIKRGVDYFRDNSEMPSYEDQQYYEIESTEIPRTSFSGQYAKNTYYYKDENDNYNLDLNDIPTLNRDYYLISFEDRLNQKIFYQKNKFYQKDDTSGKYILCDYESVVEARQQLGTYGEVYWLEFDNSKDIVIAYEVDGKTQTYIGHPLKEPHPVLLAAMIDIPNDNIENFYLDKDEDGLISFKNIRDSLNDASIYTVPQNYVFITAELQTKLYVTGKYYYQNDFGDYILSYDNLNSHNNYYTLDTIIPLEKKFYLPNKYYRETAENVFKLDESSKYDEEVSYYIKQRLFVINDYTGRCPYGYEWSNYSLYVPASVTLASRTETLMLFEIRGFENGSNSINGSLLQLQNYLESENLDTRDKNTYRGSLNQIQDYLYSLGRLIPNRILYINDFGQLVSSSIKYSDLIKIMKKQEQIMAL